MNIEEPIDLLFKAISKESNLHEKSRMILNSFKEKNVTSAQMLTNGLLSLIEMQFLQGNQENIDAFFLILSKVIIYFPLSIIQIVKGKILELTSKWSFMKGLQQNIVCQGELFTRIEESSISEFGLSILSNLLSCSIDQNFEKQKTAGKTLNKILEKRSALNSEISHKIRDFFVENFNSQDSFLSLLKLFDFVMKNLGLEYIGDFVYLFLKVLKSRDDNLNCRIFLSLEVNLLIKRTLSERSVSSDISENVAKELLYEPVSIEAEQNHLQAYYQCLLQSLIRLNIVFPQGARVLLPTFLSLAVELIDSERKEVSQFCAKSIQNALITIITPAFWIGNVEEELLELDVNDNSKLWDRTIAVMTYLMSKRFEKHQKVCFSILATFFETTTKDSLHIVENLVRRLISSIEEAPKEEFQLCIHNILNSLGPEFLTQMFPFKFNHSMNILSTNFEAESNFWLLHLMNVHLKSASLNFFIKNILPIVQQVEMCTKNEIDERKVLMLNAISGKLWNLLGKCWKIEISQDFSQLDEILRLSISKVECGNDTVIRSLISLVSSSFESTEIKVKLSKFSSEIIPKLAKCLDTFPHISRDILLCIEAFSMVAPNDYLERVWVSNVEKQLKVKMSKQDVSIVVALSFGIDMRGNKWNLALQIIQKLLNSQDFFQKKGYKLITLIIPKIHESFYSSILHILQNAKNVALSARGFRINVLQLLWQRGLALLTVESFQEKGIAFIQEFLPEIVLTLKERFAGNSSLMKSDSLVALAAVAKFIPEDLLPEIHELCLILIKEEVKETFLAIVKFYKSLSSCHNIQPFLKDLLPEIFNNPVKEACSVHLRYFLEKITKKFSEDFIKNLLPNENWKLLRHIRKQKNRTIKKRKKAIDSEHENTNTNLPSLPITHTSLKFDLENNKFHFVEKSVANTTKEIVNDDPAIKIVDGKLVVRDIPKESIGRKRKREAIEDDIEQPKSKSHITNVSSGPAKVHSIKESGETFRHLKSKGDVRLPGKPDPYAFIQLSHKALNKRHKAKTVKEFEEVMKPSGSLKGLAMKKVKPN